jgi:RNA polymerase sigma-70 factor (ECF subfamily)
MGMDESELRRRLEQLHRESYGWALCCCGRRAGEAEEALQSAYVKVLEGAARFDGRCTLKTWVFAVIRRTAADQRRRALARRALLWRWRARETADVPADAELEERDSQAMLQRCLADLSQRQRQLVQLVFYHDLSLSEAAGAMGVSVGAARRHYDRAKVALRRSLSEGRLCDERGNETRAVAAAL